MKKHMMKFPDYEDADEDRVNSMIGAIGRLGGKVTSYTAEESDCEAVIYYTADDEAQEKIKKHAESVDLGWEVS